MKTKITNEITIETSYGNLRFFPYELEKLRDQIDQKLKDYKTK